MEPTVGLNMYEYTSPNGPVDLASSAFGTMPWIAVVENYQQADGSILIPEVLRPYMGIDRIPAP